LQAAVAPLWWVSQRRALLAPVVAAAVSTLAELPAEPFAAALRTLHPALAALVCHDQLAVRQAVSGAYSSRVHALLVEGHL
jgi:hypothetical protein